MLPHLEERKSLIIIPTKNKEKYSHFKKKKNSYNALQIKSTF